ncbi:MAG: hypothetical protein HYU30_04435 [Chloroflexi bacterium]|nr:hypothetical protein [Chloroflexota bacterium]
MTSKAFGTQELQAMARLLGVEIPTERLEGLAQQVDAVYQGLARLGAVDLREVEPAASFRLPWRAG